MTTQSPLPPPPPPDAPRPRHGRFTSEVSSSIVASLRIVSSASDNSPFWYFRRERSLLISPDRSAVDSSAPAR